MVVAYPVVACRICIFVAGGEIQLDRDVTPFIFGSNQRAMENLLLMACMFIAVCLCGNNDSVLHYRLRVERLLGSGAYSKALMVGEKSDETDASLTMLRAYALSRSGQLGERLFEFPLTGGSYALLPDGKGVRCLLYPEDRIVRALSIRKKEI